MAKPQLEDLLGGNEKRETGHGARASEERLHQAWMHFMFGPAIADENGTDELKLRVVNERTREVELIAASQAMQDGLLWGESVILHSDFDKMERFAALFLSAVERLGHELPDGKLAIERGELFFRDGQVEEVRVTGRALVGSDALSPDAWQGWNTPQPSRVRKDPNSRSLLMDGEDEARCYIAVVLVEGVFASRQGDTTTGVQGALLEPEYRMYLRYDLRPPEARVVVEDDDSSRQTLARAPKFMLHTSQEVDALMRAAADGSSGLHYRTDPQAGTRTHSVPGLTHYVQLALTPEELARGMTSDALELLSRDQSADCDFALMYVSRVLAPPSPLPPNAYAGGWVALDDVIEKIGWKPRSTREREEMRAQVWRYLQFGARARVMGRRSSTYRDPEGKEIETRIDGPLWTFLKEEKAVQPNLFPDENADVPLRVEIVVSKEWTRLITAPETAQYLPLGELLASITADQPSGAWARVLGLSLANFWRRHPQGTLDSTIRPTRRELLERYPAKVSPHHEVLSSKNPKRALEYWRGALGHLVEKEFLAREGEALRSVIEMTAALPRYGWQEVWLDERVELHPGVEMRSAVQACADSLPTRKPRALAAKDRPAPSTTITGKKRGRPRK